MRIEILKQALAEIKAERATVTESFDSTINGLIFLIERESEKAIPSSKDLTQGPRLINSASKNDKDQTYIDLAVRAIEEAGTDLRIGAIFDYVVRFRPNIKRNGLWANIASHVSRTGSKSRLVKTGTATYGIRRAA